MGADKGDIYKKHEIKLRLKKHHMDMMETLKDRLGETTYTGVLKTLIEKEHDNMIAVNHLGRTKAYYKDLKAFMEIGDDIQQMITEINAIGININQIARKCNALGKIPARDYFEDKWYRILDIIDELKEVLSDGCKNDPYKICERPD